VKSALYIIQCGSDSAQGAGSALTEWILRRLHSENSTTGDFRSFERSISRSFLISADQAHAQHPNYKVHNLKNCFKLIFKKKLRRKEDKKEKNEKLKEKSQTVSNSRVNTKKITLHDSTVVRLWG